MLGEGCACRCVSSPDRNFKQESQWSPVKNSKGQTAPCCSCAISTIFPVLSAHKCVSSWMIVFSTGRFTFAKTTLSCNKTYSNWRYGQDSGGWSSKLGNDISWAYAASHPTYTPWKTTSWSKSHQSPTSEFISLGICLDPNTWAPSPKKQPPASAYWEEREVLSRRMQKNSLIPGPGQVGSWVQCCGLGSIPTEKH